MMQPAEQKYSAYEMAKWIRDAAKLHEESWVMTDIVVMGLPKGEYKVSLQQACDQVVPAPWNQLAFLALAHWWNDVLDWAKQQIEEVDGSSDSK
jgi:hypothetical protein